MVVVALTRALTLVRQVPLTPDRQGTLVIPCHPWSISPSRLTAEVYKTYIVISSCPNTDLNGGHSSMPAF